MDKATRSAVREEFHKYDRMFGHFGNKPVSFWTSPLDWLVLSSLYSKKNKPPNDVSHYRKMKHYFRVYHPAIGQEGNDVYVFMTHVIDVQIKSDGTPTLTSNLYWKYSPTPDPLDSLEAQMEGSSLVDSFVQSPLSNDSSVLPHDADTVLESSVLTKKTRWERMGKKIKTVRDSYWGSL